MRAGFLKRLASRVAERRPSRRRPLRAVQVEVSSHCTRRCAYCPRTVWQGRWRNGHLSRDAWQAVLPGLRLAEHVHLQGWGEPLLHPDLCGMVREAKQAGCTVGLTTNGDLLAGAAARLLGEGLDLVSLSLAGGKVYNPALRDGVSLEEALRRVEAFQEINRRGGHGATVKVSYLLTRQNAGELAEAAEAAARAGADEFYVIHLDCVPSEPLLGSAAFSGGVRGAVRDAFRSARRAASRNGLPLRLPPLDPEDVLACALNPLFFVFVARDGRVGPCVNQLFSLSGPVPRWDDQGSRLVEPAVYGSLGPARPGLEAILESEGRKGFLAPFRRRLEAEQAFRRRVAGPGERVSVEAIEEADAARQRSLDAHPFPGSCAGCPKRWGF